jgi:hypothetical protein
MGRRSAPGIKKPPAGHPTPEGVSTRAVWKPSHTARFRAGRRLHRRARHGTGYYHTDRPTRKPEDFPPTTTLYICRAGAFLSREGHLALTRSKYTGKRNAPGTTAQGTSELDSLAGQGTSQLGVYMIEKAQDEWQGGVSGGQEMCEGVGITLRLLIATSTKC